MLFRLLRADEIDVRVSNVGEKGVTLLLYKDARCDMNILDETVGPFNWQRQHTRDNANCIVSIYDEKRNEWVSKEDTGTESYTEKEKGLASDSFKRACFNWGIGRELYTAPFIYIKAEDTKIDTTPKLTCKDTFEVSEIEYIDNSISYLAIKSNKTKSITTFGRRSSTPEPVPVEKPKKAEAKPKKVKEEESAKDTTDVRITAINSLGLRKGFSETNVCKLFKKSKYSELTAEEYSTAVEKLNNYPDKEKRA